MFSDRSWLEMATFFTQGDLKFFTFVKVKEKINGSKPQLLIWSTDSCILLTAPLRIISDSVVSTYFHRFALGRARSLIIRRKSQGPSLVPCGTSHGTKLRHYYIYLKIFDVSG